jgi:hypothetical protein
MKKKVLLLACIPLFLIGSCKKLGFDKIASTAWDPNLAIPLAYGTFGVSDIFTYNDTANSVFIDENTGLVKLIYRSELLVASALDFVTLGQFDENVVFSGSDLNIPATGSLTGTANTSNNQNMIIDVPNGVEIHSLHLKSGMLAVNVSTTLAHDVTALVTLPGVTVSGAPVQQTVTLNYQGAVPHSNTAMINLAGATMDCSLGNTTSNTVQVTLQNTITGSGAGISGNESVSLNLSSTNMAFDLAYGYFGQQTVVDLQDSILIKLFDNGTGSGYFELTNPSLRLFVESSMGLPIRLNINDLRTISVLNDQEFTLNNYPAVHNINFPAILGVAVETMIEFTTTNTPDLANVITPVPQYLAYGFTALTNPDGPGATLNFLRDTSKIKVRSELELPLEGFASGFGVKDTFNFGLGVGAKNIEYVMLRLIIDNGFPVEMDAQITFMNENYATLFTAWDSPVRVVDSGVTDVNGVVVQRKTAITDITIDGSDLELLKQAKFVEVRATAQTRDAQNSSVIKIYDWYTIKLKLGMQIQANFDI